MEKSITFSCYRYFIIPFEQISFKQLETSNKNQLVKNIFLTLEEEHKIEKTISKSPYILYFTHKYSDNLYLCKFARQSYRTAYHDIGTDIELSKEENFPFIYLIVDTYRQIILIQNKSDASIKFTTFRNSLEKWFQSNIYDLGFEFKLDEMSDEYAFWDYVKSAEKIYELSLNLKSPNLFGGKTDAEEFLREVKSDFNTNETNLAFKNTKGALTITDVIKNFIKYITSGGGKWRLKADIPGKKRKSNYYSAKSIRKAVFPENIEFLKDNVKDKIEESMKKFDIRPGDDKNDKKYKKTKK